MSTLRISQVAERTGFSAATLRYYESIGLLVADRTPSGYRVYDDRDVAKLRFLGQGKRMGLRLEQLRELMELWEGDECAPTQQRLLQLLEAQRADAAQALTELRAFADELDQVGARLTDAGPTGGPCGDICGCVTHAEPELLTTAHPGEVVGLPVACTLGSDDFAERLGRWQAFAARAIGRRELVDGVALHFPPGRKLASAVADLAVAEQDCCRFFDFSLQLAATGTTMEIRAPAHARELVDALVGVRS